MKVLKIIFYCILFGLIVGFFGKMAFSQSFPKPTGYINDYAKVFFFRLTYTWWNLANSTSILFHPNFRLLFS